MAAVSADTQVQSLGALSRYAGRQSSQKRQTALQHEAPSGEHRESQREPVYLIVLCFCSRPQHKRL